jgi:hypothetical protein
MRVGDKVSVGLRSDVWPFTRAYTGVVADIWTDDVDGQATELAVVDLDIEYRGQETVEVPLEDLRAVAA